MIFRRLLTGDLGLDEFLATPLISTNGKLAQDIVRRVEQDHGELPDAYKRFLEDISKVSSVCGYLQFTGPQGMTILEQYLNRSINLRSPEQKENLLFIKSEVPALFEAMNCILNFENEEVYLPLDVAIVIKKLITMRVAVFSNSPARKTEDYFYFDEENKEHETQFYPNWKLFRYHIKSSKIYSCLGKISKNKKKK